MGYKEPAEVISPKDRWKFVETVCNTGQGGFSVVEGVWDNDKTVAIRWNGDDVSSSSGTPQSTGWPTWFILPHELHGAVRHMGMMLNKSMALIKCELTAAEDLEPGTYKVRIEITNHDHRAEITDTDIRFKFPNLPRIQFRHIAGSENIFFAPPLEVGSQWEGKIVGGKWFGVVQTNVFEDEKIGATQILIRDALIEQVAHALIPYQHPHT